MGSKKFWATAMFICLLMDFVTMTFSTGPSRIGGLIAGIICLVSLYANAMSYD